MPIRPIIMVIDTITPIAVAILALLKGVNF